MSGRVFPVFETTVYVNSCSQGALSDAVRAAYDEYLDGWDENGAQWEYWVERSEAARAAFAGLLGAGAGRRRDPDLRLGGGQRPRSRRSSSAGERNRIVISDYEFPTIGQIAHAQELRGAEVVHVEPESRRRTPPRSTSAPRSSPRRSSPTGRARSTTSRRSTGSRSEHGALMLVDGYQGIGAIPLDAPSAGDDVVGGTVKYLLASAGLAFMALRPGLVEELVPVADGLVRGRERLRHADRALPAAPQRAPLRRGHAARAEHLRRASRASA